MGQLDRWGAIASELGVQETVASVPPPAPAPAPPKPTLPAAAPQNVAPRPPKPATDWSRLADDLGLDARVVAAAAPRTPVAKPPVAPPVASPPRASEQTAREARPESRREQGQRAESFGGHDRPQPTERFDRQRRDDRRRPDEVAEPRYNSVEGEPSAIESDTSREAECESSYDAPRQEGRNRKPEEGSQSRRRNRRGRGGRGRGQRGEASSRDSRSSHSHGPVDIDNPPENPDTSDAPWSVELGQRSRPDFSEFDEPEMLDEDGIPVTEASLEETGPRKRRRRRRGGRGRKRGDRGEQNRGLERTESPDAESVADEEAPGFDAQGTTEYRERRAPADDSRDADLEHESEWTGGHRTVPSWEEAVGVLVSANLEARARCPNSHGSQKNRGRGRSGRGKRGSH